MVKVTETAMPYVSRHRGRRSRKRMNSACLDLIETVGPYTLDYIVLIGVDDFDVIIVA